MMKLALLVACLFATAAAGIISSDPVPVLTDLQLLAAPGRHRASIESDGLTRQFIVITPSAAKPGASLPLLFFFHGAGGSAQQALHTYGWAEKAERENFIAVLPDGLPARLNESASFLFNPRVWRENRPHGFALGEVDDLAFFEQLLDRLESVLPVDRHRIYVTGFSNGAGLTFALGARFSGRLAAIAPVSSQSFIAIDKLEKPLPVYYLTGKSDPLIPFQGGTSKLPWGQVRSTPPIQDSVDFWVKLDGCPPAPQVISDEKGVRVVRYGPGHEGAEIIFTTVDGNGHHWPGTREPLPSAVAGPALDPFSATDRIWDFFQRHTR